MASCGVLIFFLLYIFGESGGKVDGCSLMAREDYSYSEEWGGFYKLHYNTKTWENARLTCQKEGATLAMPHSIKDARIISRIISPAQFSCGTFIGGKEVLSTGQYTTIEGVSLCRIPHEWANNSPNSTTDSCLVLLQDGTLADESCNESLPFVCYKKMDPECNACRNPCKANDRGYKFEQSTGSCYKFHDIAKNWADSVRTCADDGGHLVIINTDAEVRALKKIFFEHPADVITGVPKFTHVIYVGFHDLFKPKDWRNLDGKNITESGYASWSPGEPNNAGHCGSMFRNGLLINIDCAHKCAFVCEIESDPV